MLQEEPIRHHESIHAPRYVFGLRRVDPSQVVDILHSSDEMTVPYLTRSDHFLVGIICFGRFSSAERKKCISTIPLEFLRVHFSRFQVTLPSHGRMDRQEVKDKTFGGSLASNVKTVCISSQLKNSTENAREGGSLRLVHRDFNP